MSNKETILHTAMRLFSEQGYDRTPTSQIAREAGVSEGLLFRHYENKAGLLRAIIQFGADQVRASMQPYQRGGDPREAIALHIRESFKIIREQTDFWRLVHQLRHQPAVKLTAEAQIGAFQREVAERLGAQFRLLGAKYPELEALLLFALIDGITLQYLQMPEAYPLETLQDFLIQKYQHGSFMDQP